MQNDFNDVRGAIQTLEADKRHAVEMQLHRGRVGSVKRPVAWRRLRERIQGRIALDQGMFRTGSTVISKMTVAPDGNSIVLDRALYPKARTRAVFNPPLIQIQYSYHLSYARDEPAP